MTDAGDAGARWRPCGRAGVSASRLDRISSRGATVLFAAVALAGVLAGPARADVVTFTGESLVDATNWHVSTNWRDQNGDHVVPTSADDAVIPSGRTAALVTGDGAVQSVVLDTNAHLDVDGQTLSVGTNGAGCTVLGGSCSRFAGVLRVVSEGTLVLAGDATWSNGGWLVDGTVENRGTLRITGNTRASASLNDLGLVRNLPGATITRATSAGQADIAVPLDNDGQVNVDTGTLLLQGGSGAETSSGGFTLAQAGTLNSLGGHRLSQGGRVTGPGTLRLDGGDFEFAGGIGAGGAYTPGTTLASGGMLDLGGGSGSTGRLTSDGGGGGGIRGGTLAVGDGVSRLDNITFQGGARVTFSPGATVDAVGTVRVNGEAVLGLDGDTTWSAGGWGIGRSGADTGIGGVVENRGDLRIVGNTLASNFGVGGGVVRNLTGATITRELSPGAAAILVPLRNAGEIVVHTGTLETIDVAQSAGAIAVAGGATFGRSTGSPIALAAGALRGSGTVIGAVANDGATVLPGPTTPETAPGRLSITGTYTQAAGGALAVDIQGPAPATGHDQLAVSGAATLAGTLAITNDTGFDPPLDSTYDVVTAGALSGRFASLTGSQLTGKRYQDEYEPTLARLRVVFAPIAPAPAEQIIFLPGFLGSRMECGGSGAWPNAARTLAMRLATNGRSDLEAPCTVPEGRAGLIEDIAGIDVYGSMLEFLEQIAPGRVHAFAYDWRKSPADSLTALDALVDRVRGGGKVVLLGHSMGGLVTRMYIDDPARAAKVARAVTLGTAYWGTPKALFPLAAGVESPLPRSLNVLIPAQDMQEFSRNLTSLYFAWPSARFRRWLTVAGRRPRPLDGPGVRSFVRFLDGNVKLYDRALADHARALDEFDVNGVDYHVVAGTGKQTIGPVQIRPIGADLQGGGNLPAGAVVPQGIYRVSWVNGDETVPRESAALGGSVPPDHLHIVCGIDHLELVQDEAVRDRIGDFLRAGAPISGADNDCPARGAEVQAFTLPLGARRTRAAGRAPGSLTPEQADRAGAIELLDLGAQNCLPPTRQGRSRCGWRAAASACA